VSGSPPLAGWRLAFAWTIFPLTFGCAMAGARALHGAGTDPRLATLFMSLSAALVVIISERIQPHAERWTVPRGDLPTDAAHMILSQMAPPQLVDALWHSAMASAAITLAAAAGTAGQGIWPAGWNIWAQLALAMALSEAGQYAWHRLCHEHGWFWRFHAVHHSSERLYWLNAGRFHPLDTMISYALHTAPLLLLGAPVQVLALFSLFTAVHGMFQHANVELRLGPLNWIFSMAELHRWHHSHDLDDANRNYGANIILWDVVFGTRHLPRDRQHDPEDVGFSGMPNFPRGYWAQLASLFRWATLEREAKELSGAEGREA